MKKRIINLTLSLLWGITLIVTVFCLTVLNKNFVIHIMDKNNYYEQVYAKIKEDFDSKGLSYELSKGKVTDDIKRYVKSRFKNEYYRFSNQDLRDDYNKHIKFNNYFQDRDICSIVYLVYLLDLILIVITGMLFLRTKGFHNLNIIMISNFIITIILFGIITLFFNSEREIINILITKFNHYYLATSIILLEITLFNKLKNKIKW